MSNTESLQGLDRSIDRLKEKRRLLEEKTKTLEEKARTEKLSIDKKFFAEILEEENRTHNEAVRELEEKIANLEQQMKTLPPMEEPRSQTPPEPVQEIPSQVDEVVSVGVLPPPEKEEVEVPQEGPKKKRRNIF